MPKREQIPGERWRQRTPKRILRWLLRFLAWSSVVTLVAVAIVALVAFSVYLNRARIVNDVLGLFVAPYDVSVGEIDLYPIGEVKVREMQISPKGTNFEVPTVAIPEIHLTYQFQRLRSERKLGSVRFEAPVITINEETLAALQKSPADGKAPASPFDLSRFAVFTESFSLNDGHLTLELHGIPRLETAWTVETPAFSFREDGSLAEPITIRLNDVTLGEAPGQGTIQSLSTGLLLSRDLSRIEIPYLRLAGVDAPVTPAWFPRRGDPEAKEATTPPGNDATGSGPAANPVEWIIRSVQLSDGTFSLTGFDGSVPGPVLPEITFDTAFSLPEIKTVAGAWQSFEPLTIPLTDIAIGAPDSRLASADRIELSTESPTAVIRERTFSSIRIEGLDVVMTDETLARCRTEPLPTSASDDPEPPGKPWIIEDLTITNGHLLLRDTHFGDTPAPHLETALDASLRDLNFGGEDGFSSREPLEMSLSLTRLRAPGASLESDPLLVIDRTELAGRWSDFNFNNRIERLALQGPRITFTDEALGDWLGAADQASPNTGPANRPVYQIADLVVTDGKLEADSQFAAGKVPKIFSDFSITTDQAEGATPYDYRLLFQNFVLRNHSIDGEPLPETPPPADPSLFPGEAVETARAGIAETEVLSVKKIEVDASAAELQRTRRIGKVKLTGAILRVGEGIKSLAGTGEEEDAQVEATPLTVADAGPKLPTWTLDEVEITQSQVRFEALIPQISGLEFAIETKLTDVPLSPDGLLAQKQLQKIELAGIEIKDPYNSFITVAFLPTIFVEFSLAGLANQEIEKIDLIGPALHVGQGLFWWIDYQRKFREQNEGASVGIETSGNPEETPDWEIKTINATAGKIVIAPTGIPIGMVPFPFNATTNMQDGRIELKLNIPDEEDYVYRFPDYEVDLYGLTGNIEFNVPIQQVSNNIVQVFALDRFVWKDYEAENLYLTVTFDENGVYGALGGEAYGGYAEGGFNFYLNDPGKWDAWIAGTEMDTRPITQVLVPDNFEMEGLVSLKLISEGRDKTLGESTGEIQTVGPGWFDITKFDAILEELPEEWSGLQRSLTELGLIALKRFDYDQGAGSLYLLGQEGKLDLRFAGAYGTRELNLHLHDNRNTTPEVAQHTDNDILPGDGPAPTPEEP